MPIISKGWIIRICLQDFLIQRQVVFIKHPDRQLFLVKILSAIILVLLFIYISLIFSPIIILKLVKYALTNSIGNMLQYTKFWIDNTLDAKRVNFLCTSNHQLTIDSRHRCFVKLQSKIIHVFKIVSTNNITIDLVIFLNKENTCKEIVTNHFW